MKISAIIAEYNPFHTGHAHHIAATRAAGAQKVIVILSGPFVQRGEPAITDKWARTEMALRGGADLVLELPVWGALSGAQGFARAAIGTLHGLGCIDTLSFGAEQADIPALQQVAEVLYREPPAYRALLSKLLAQGHSFPKARSMALEDYLGADAAALASSPNNILALEYLQALRHFCSHITPLAIPRRASYLATQPEGTFASALAIRTSLAAGKADWQPFVHPQDAALLSQPLLPDALFLPLLTRLRTMTLAELSGIADVSEGLEHRIFKAARSAGTWDALLEGIQTKRYPLARIKRILLHCLLGITQADMASYAAAQPYARVLGVRKQSMELLSLLQRSARIPVYTKLPKTDLPPALQLDLLASDLSALGFIPPRPAGMDHTKPLIVL